MDNRAESQRSECGVQEIPFNSAVPLALLSNHEEKTIHVLQEPKKEAKTVKSSRVGSESGEVPELTLKTPFNSHN